jgi:threonine dehydrogenase-like Zn-dependent dehydrogenase
MKAFVHTVPGHVGFKEKPVPDNPGPHDAIIKTGAALLCTSDIHAVERKMEALRNVTLGHEAVGFVYKLGSHIKGLKEGDRVAVSATTPCFRCEDCLRGSPSQCRRMLGGVKFGNRKDGVLAEYFHVNDADANLEPIHESIPNEAAVYATDMIPTGVMGASNAGIPIGGAVAVFAQGPVGLMVTAGARLLGAGLVITVEGIPERKELSKRFGADRVLDFKEVDPVKEILRLTEGKGVDSAIDSLGAQETFEACVKVTRPGGTISEIGYFAEGEYIGIPRVEWGFGMGEKTIRSGLCPGGKDLLRRMLRLMQTGRIDPTPLTTHVFQFNELDRAFHMMKEKADGIIKPLIIF